MVVKKTSTDYALLEMLSDEHEPFAREAFIEFHDRYSSFIYNTCYSFVLDRYGHDAKSHASDLSQMVFKKILKGSRTFKPKKNIDPKEIVFHVRGWLLRIAKNIFIDEYIKKQERRPELVRIGVEDQDKREYDFIKKEENKERHLSPENKIKYELILKAKTNIKMSDKENTVLKVYLESGWFDDRGNWNLPSSRMEELMEKYNLARNSIIQCKNRLIAKIKTEVKKSL
tara:strand:+ start:245 stop:928 length:684 start_codon:yes stop_codon:yes gene_type:complete